MKENLIDMYKMYNAKSEKGNKLSQQFGDLHNMEALISSENLRIVKNPIDKGIANSDNVLNKTRTKIRFCYCPCCGLRKPASGIFGYYGGHCPVCGYRMIEEAALPYIPGKLKYNTRYFLCSLKM